jgi:hypothetical protein
MMLIIWSAGYYAPVRACILRPQGDARTRPRVRSRPVEQNIIWTATACFATTAREMVKDTKLHTGVKDLAALPPDQGPQRPSYSREAWPAVLRTGRSGEI